MLQIDQALMTPQVKANELSTVDPPVLVAEIVCVCALDVLKLLRGGDLTQLFASSAWCKCSF